MIDSNTNIMISTHANMSEEIIPKVGMEFETEQDIYDFYNKYAKEVGFSIRRSKGHKDKYGNWVDGFFVVLAKELEEMIKEMTMSKLIVQKQDLGV